MRRAKIILAAAAALAAVASASWGSPIPTFDKEAVVDFPYMRTGAQEVPVEQKEVTPSPRDHGPHSGNTGTAEDPAFYVRRIRLTGYEIPDDKGELAKILAGYCGRDVKVSELPQLRYEVTEYCREAGFTVPLAVIPAQEVKSGVLEVHIFVAVYDDVTLTLNKSDIYDKTLNKYLRYMKKGKVITDARLEKIVNNINDLPAVQARAILRPGAEAGSTAIDFEVEKRKVWNNYIFTDNGGGHYSGRWRFGVNTELNNLSRTGDKLILSGIITEEETKSYSVRYERHIGHQGTRWGIAYSQTNYEFAPNDLYDTLGESRGISVYGITPVHKDRSERHNLIYGYDRRKITDGYRFRDPFFRPLNFDVDKVADVWHIGFAGSRYRPDQILQYSLIYWYGDIGTDGGAYYDGAYHKLTADFLKIWYWNRYNFRLFGSGQLASRELDSSEQLFLGGMNGVRAYANGDGYGDSAFVSTAELRWQTDTPGLELAAFIDVAAGKNLASGETDHISGWGLGVRYTKKNDWHAQFDWARKINGRPDRSEPGDDDYRLWFQLYIMF